MSSSVARRQALLSSVRAFPIALLGGAALLASLSLVPARAQQAPATVTPAAAAAAPAAPASAQVEEVTITARDRAEKAQDVPLPLSAIGQKSADREITQDWKDVVQRVPSFTPAIANPRTGANGLRGITGISGGADGSEGDVGLIVDNVFYTHIGFSWLTFYDIDSIQIARGPQGTLLGKNTTTGAIIVNTNQPRFEPQTTTETTLGSRRLVEEKFTTTGTLVPDEIAYRISTYGEKQDGFIKEPYYPQAPKGQDKDRWGVRAQLLGTFGDVTDRLIFEHLYTDETNNTWGTYNDGYTTYFNGAPRAISATNAAGVKATFNNPASVLQYLFPQFASRVVATNWSSPTTNVGPIQTHTTGASNELNWRLGDYTLTSVTAVRHFDFHPNNSDGDFGTYNNINNITGYDVGANQYSEEIRLASPTGQKIDWTTGAYFLHEVIDSNSRRQFGPDAVALQQKNATNTGLNSSAILNGVEADLFGRAGITTYAQFAQGTYHYDEHASLTLGVRNSYEIRSASDTGYYFGGAALPANLSNVRTDYIISAVGGTNFVESGVQRTDSISYLINPAYKFNDNVTVYANVGRGVKSGAANTVYVPVYNTISTYPGMNRVYPSVNGFPIITQPEVSLDYELGFKSNWFDNHFQINGNAYWNDIYNFQATLSNWYSFSDTSGNTTLVNKTYLGNVPQVRLAGFELEGRYSPLENLWINFAGAYNGAWYVKFTNQAPPNDYASVAPNGTVLNVSGARVPNVTPYSFSLGANYEYLAGSFLSENWRGYVWGTGFYKSTTLFSLDAAYTLYVLKQPDYFVFNAGVGFKSTDEKYDIQVWAKNLLNRQAVSTLSLSTTTALGGIDYIEPLTVGVTFRTKF